MSFGKLRIIVNRRSPAPRLVTFDSISQDGPGRFLSTDICVYLRNLWFTSIPFDSVYSSFNPFPFRICGVHFSILDSRVLDCLAAAK